MSQLHEGFVPTAALCPNCGAHLQDLVEINGIRWKSKKSYENAWNSTEIHGKQMEIHGILWKFNGNLRNSMETHGIQ